MASLYSGNAGFMQQASETIYVGKNTTISRYPSIKFVEVFGCRKPENYESFRIRNLPTLY